MSKRKAISLEDKLSIVRKIENGARMTDVSRDYGFALTTISSIWSNRAKLTSAGEHENHKRKKLRTTAHVELDAALLQWFTQKRAQNVPLDGPFLKGKADQLAMILKIENFSCSNGWLDRFKKRHSISFGKLTGEARDVDGKLCDDWLNEKWPEIRDGYNDCEIFNADETGLFFRLLPDGTLKFKTEKCVGGKLSKVRLTVLVCANMDGTERRKLLVIGKSQRPRCFKNIKSLPVRYVANKKAWMTSSLFQEELQLWDRELVRRNRKILLLVDNCPAHPNLKTLKNIKLVFLPVNTTSVLQPMDQGVIRCLKHHYRRLLVAQLIKCLDANETMAVSVLDAIHFLHSAWNQVTSEKISNCFRHAFKSNAPSNAPDTSSEMNLPQTTHLSDEELRNFLEFNEDVVTSNVLTDEEIVQQVLEKKEDNESEDEDDVQLDEQPVTINQAMEAASLLTKFFGSCENTQPEMFGILSKINFDLSSQYLSKGTKQKKITDFTEVITA